jgi:hypothetical protein
LLVGVAACFSDAATSAMLGTMGALLLAWTVCRAAATSSFEIPAECATVGDTVRVLLSLNQGPSPRPARQWEPNEVWDTLRRVVAEQFDVPLEVITVNTDFVRDLGAD